MMKYLFCTLLFFTFLGISSAQKLEVLNVVGGYKPVYEGKKLRLSELKNLLKDHPDTYPYYNKYSTNLTLAGVTSFVGGGLVGWPVGASLAGGEPNWNLAIIGAGLIAVSIPFQIGANKNLRKVATTYNNGLEPEIGAKNKPRPKVEFGLTSVRMTF